MQIDHINWPGKRIYLHPDTVVSGYDPIETYFEHNALIQANANNEQNYYPAGSAEGNIPKGGGNFTPSYFLMLTGWRVVPFDGVDHILRLLGETVSVEGLSDRDVFDRSTVSVNVDIDPIYDAVEVREIEVAQSNEGLSSGQCYGPITATLIELPAVYANLEEGIRAKVVDQEYSGKIESDVTATVQINEITARVCC